MKTSQPSSIKSLLASIPLKTQVSIPGSSSEFVLGFTKQSETLQKLLKKNNEAAAAVYGSGYSPETYDRYKVGREYVNFIGDLWNDLKIVHEIWVIQPCTVDACLALIDYIDFGSSHSEYDWTIGTGPCRKELSEILRSLASTHKLRWTSISGHGVWLKIVDEVSEQEFRTLWKQSIAYSLKHFSVGPEVQENPKWWLRDSYKRRVLGYGSQ